MKAGGWVLVTLAVVAIVLFVTSPILVGAWHLGSTEKEQAPPPALKTQITEADFESLIQADIDASNPRTKTEWRAARADHRGMVHAILACENRLGELGSMRPAMFSALLLDLTPTGTHELGGGGDEAPPPVTGKASAAAGSEAGRGAIQGAFSPLRPGEAELLVLSDSIARARLLTAAEINDALPDAKTLWWVVLVVSGLASLLVALQSQFKAPAGEMPPPSPLPARPERPGPEPSTKDTQDYYKWQEVKNAYDKFDWDGWADNEKNAYIAAANRRMWLARWFFSHGIAIFAIAFSIAGTTLAGLKQYYDPSGALSQNESTLLALRSLHQQLLLEVGCQNPGWPDANFGFVTPDARKSFLEDMKRLGGRITSPYAATGGLAK